MTDDQLKKIEDLTRHPSWSVYLELAEEMIQREDRISTLPKFKTATALQKHLEIKRKAFEMFSELINTVSYTNKTIKIEKEFKPYKTVDK